MQVRCVQFYFHRENTMKWVDVNRIAKPHSIKPGRLSKTELLGTIQTDEGNFPLLCYRR